MFEDEKREVPWGQIILLVIGIVVGIISVEVLHFDLIPEDQLLFCYLVALISFFLSIVIHELGHLVAGLATGYRFVSFRVGTLSLCYFGDPPEPVEESEEGEEPPPEEEIPVEETPTEETIEARRQMQLEMGVPEILEELDLETLEEEEEDEIDLEYIPRHFSLKKAKVPGTAGQCLLAPPNYKDPHHVPYKAYLMGGGIANLISIPFSLITLLIFPNAWLLVAIFVLIALGTALSNLIPMKVSGLPNDGYNIKLCKNDPHSHAALVYQLRIAAALADGISVGDMPEEWFYAKFPMSERMTLNPLIANLWNFTGDRFLIHGELFQAKIIYEAIANAKGLMLLMRIQGMYSYLFTMISEGRVEQVKIYLVPKHFQKQAKALENYLPLYAMYRYGFGKLVVESGKIMKESMAKFEKAAKHYPYQGEILDARVLMDRLDDVIVMR
ncbi:MAG: hypothetical protein R3Y63_01535 [Eubacteriales bacterium]